MCGICGFTGEIVDRSTVITKMTDVITHRGPDSSGVFEGEGMIKGKIRLAGILMIAGKVYFNRLVQKKLLKKSSR